MHRGGGGDDDDNDDDGNCGRGFFRLDVFSNDDITFTSAQVSYRSRRVSLRKVPVAVDAVLTLTLTSSMMRVRTFLTLMARGSRGDAGAVSDGMISDVVV